LQDGYPFNRFITILWQRAGIAPDQNAATTARFIKLASDWAQRRGYRMRWAFVQESGPKNGAHVHILLHIPRAYDLAFSPMPLKWVKRCLGTPYKAKTLQSQKIEFSNAVDTNARAYKAALMGKVHYMLKCAPRALEETLGMVGLGHKAWGQECVTYAKRLSAWQVEGRVKNL
jgi:hypothetical protein